MNAAGPVRPKPIIARDQIRLGLGRCWQLAVSGMSYRLFRSMVTTAILALAAAFLVHMLGFGLIESETQRVAQDQTQASRRLGQDIYRLNEADTDRAILAVFETNDTQRLGEYVRWGGLDPAEVEAARATARDLSTVVHYFEDLGTAPKAVILGDRTPEELIDHLATPAQLATFERHLRQFALRPPLSDLGTFAKLVSERRAQLRSFIARIRVGQSKAIAALATKVGPVHLALEHSTPSLREAMLQAGYDVSSSRLQRMHDAALDSRDKRTLEEALARPQVLGAVARRVGAEPKNVNFENLTGWITTKRDAEWLFGTLSDAGITPLPSAERIDRLLDEHRRERHVSRIASARPRSQANALWGLSARAQWLVVLSFLVCMVGVANAMLMSVTERFTEIATMKCLGALDRFVMTMFVLEALIQGAVGGFVGLLLGILLAIIRGAVEFGELLGLASGVAATVGLSMLLSLAATMVLAALSAVGPAYVAARLSPMEAMRVE